MRSKQEKELIIIDLSRQQKLELLQWQPHVISVILSDGRWNESDGE